MLPRMSSCSRHEGGIAGSFFVGEAWEQRFQHAMTMSNCEYSNAFRTDLVDQPIALHEAFPDCRIVQLWNEPPALRQISQRLRSREKSRNDSLRIPSGVPLDISGDLLHVFYGFR